MPTDDRAPTGFDRLIELFQSDAQRQQMENQRLREDLGGRLQRLEDMNQKLEVQLVRIETRDSAKQAERNDIRITKLEAAQHRAIGYLLGAAAGGSIGGAALTKAASALLGGE